MSLLLSALVVTCLSLLVNGQWNNGGQFWGMNRNNMQTNWGNQANIGWWNRFQQPPQEYRTCVGRNNYGDEMRITFTPEEQSPANSWFMNINRRQNLRFKAALTSRALQGQFTYVVTRLGRVEDYCSSVALGEVLNNNQFLPQGRTQVALQGVIGNPFRVTQGQRSSTSDLINTLTLDEINGRGVALCPLNQLSGTTCFGAIHLCCKLGRDSQDVTLGLVPGAGGQLINVVANPAMGVMGTNPGMGVIGNQMGGSMVGSPMGGIGAPTGNNGLGGTTNPGFNFGGGLVTGQDTAQPATNVEGETGMETSADSFLGALTF